jgi:DNA-binding transcriptional LysR family regulator
LLGDFGSKEDDMSGTKFTEKFKRDAVAQVADRGHPVRKLVASAEPFAPITATRRFVVRTPNGGSAEVVLALLKKLRATAPGIDLGFVSIPRTQSGWDHAFARLDDRKVDVAILPFRNNLGFAEVPARFVTRFLYCAAQHLLVSVTGEIDGIVDRYLAEIGRSRRVAVTVPNSMVAFEMVESTDLVVSAPRRLVTAQLKRFGLASAELPFTLPKSQIRLISTKAGLADDGLVWLPGAIEGAL